MIEVPDGGAAADGRWPSLTRKTYFQTEPHFQQPAVTAPFADDGAARRAAEALREAGFDEVQVDRVSPYPVERGDVDDQPFPLSLTGQAGDDRRVLSAADPAISGLAAAEPAADEPYLLTVVLPDRPGAREEALRILRDHGARVGIDHDGAGSNRHDRRPSGDRRGGGDHRGRGDDLDAGDDRGGQ